MKTPHIAIIGAGIGGIASAIVLASSGHRVTVIERAERAGGKIRSCSRQDLALDVGPTVMTLPSIFADLFSRAGESMDARLSLEPLSTLAHHRWRDGSRLDLSSDLQQSLTAVADFAGDKAASEYQHFVKRARDAYELLDRTFISQQQRGLVGLLRRCSVTDLFALSRIKPFRSLWRDLKGAFTDPRLRQLFARYATYCGSSPMQAPSTLMLIADVEQRGVWRMHGGMRQLAAELFRCATRLGVEFKFTTDAERVSLCNGRVARVETSAGESVPVDAVVINADAQAIVNGAFGPELTTAVTPVAIADRSLSAVTFAGQIKTTARQLNYHNVFFSDDYEHEFAEISRDNKVPNQPTTYVCAPDFEQAGRQRLFVLVNAPANGDSIEYDASHVDRVRHVTEEQLLQCGLTIDLSDFEVTTPNDFEHRYSNTGGALYGPAMHGWQAAFRRPANSTSIPGLYIAGGSAHPGSGVPMAALSGKLCAEQLMSDLGGAHAKR